MNVSGPIALVGALMAAFVPQDDPTSPVFDALEKSIRAGDEAAFQARWHPEGFDANLVGRGGLAGREVFAQGARKKWVLKPDAARTRVLGEGAARIVPCAVWAWEQAKAVDKVDLLLVRDKDAWLVLGGGEKAAGVDALAARWLEKKPLPGE
jgi:hypothetical protein